MQTDKDKGSPASEPVSDNTDSSQEATLNWLMDELDKDEPSENLFVVDRQEPVDTSLSAFEVEIAARPMSRGRAGADDFDSYVGEEIVISSEGAQSDIYSGFDVDEPEDELEIEENMALDFSVRDAGNGSAAAASVSDGTDILGLEDEDDIGDTYLVVKRVKKAQAEPAPVAPPSPENESEAIVLADPSVVEPDAAAESGLTLEQTTQDVEHIAQSEEAAPQVDAQGISVDASDVSDYIANNVAPSDDTDFDAFLVAGSQLAAGDAEIEELSLAPEDDSFLDAGPGEVIDYPEEMQALAEEGEGLIAAVTPLLGGLMEELATAMATRLAAMGKPGDAVHSDLSLATDATSEGLARNQGYAPIMSICDQVPEALAGLSEDHLQAIYLRLSWIDSGEACNDLFQSDDASIEELVLEEIEGVAGVLPEADEFGEGVFDDTFALGDLPVHESTPETVFDDLAEEPSAFEHELPPLAVVEVTDESREPDAPVSAEQDSGFGDTFDIDEPLEASSAAPELALVDSSPAEQAPDVFGEDIFEGDLLETELATATDEETDIDALFDDLGQEDQGGDAICGVAMQEFDGGDNAAVENQEVAASAELVPEAVEAQDLSWCIPGDIQFSQSSPTSGEIFAEFLDAFVEEGTSELEKLEDAVAAWEADAGSDDAFKVVSRILHTIKGIAKGVGLHYYGTLIHNFETLLERMPRPDADVDSDYFRIVNAWLDATVRGLEHVREQRADITCELPYREGSVQQPETTVADTAPEGEKAPTLEAETPAAVPVEPAPRDAGRKAQDKQLADEGARALAAQQSVRITSEKLDLLLNLTNQAQQLGVRTAQSTARTKRTSAELQARLSSVRSHIADIADRALFNVTARGSAGPSAEMDALEMDRYSELQEAANILSEGVEDLAELIEIASRNNTQAEALLKQQASVISSIGSSIRAARVVPVSRLMPGLRRLVRTVSNDLGKNVAFRVANEVGTLDRDDYTRCQTILEHMVRNAMDHGIESAQERTDAGKPSVGQITVDVRMSGSDSIIVLSDDGRGIDPNALRESAIRKGLDIDAYALSDEEALRLIFHRGFSTAQSVSQISGRGVGMDIVLSELQQMGGDVDVRSEPGKGTSFHIRIPSNVTVNGALLVTAGEASYAIPLGGLIAVDEVQVDEFFGAVERGDTLSLGGFECEPAYLGTLCRSGNLPERSTWRRSVPVILAGSDARYMAIAIDDVEEALELVIRSLGAQFASVPGVAGAATTADGEAVVALDLNLLVASFEEGQGTAIAVEEAVEERFLALVVDDSRTQRMVATSQLETVGIETATAENGAVAIDWLNTTEQLPDVILLDVEMPVKDGIQTLREIRKSARYSHIPVIMVTSRTGVKHRTMAEEAGCNGYMGKPFNFRMLIGQINELTGHRLQLG